PSPDGNDPPTPVQLYGPVPPVAASVAVYPAPTVATGRLGVVIVGGVAAVPGSSVYTDAVTVAISARPSPLKSPTTSECGVVPRFHDVGDWNVPSPLPGSTVTAPSCIR